MWKAQILVDSVNPCGDRLTTFELCYPAIIHAQVLTHRVFSRNASSSRAIPALKMIEEVEKHGYVPEVWGKNQKGMVAGDNLRADCGADNAWASAKSDAIVRATELHNLGVHKQWANRLLYPFMWMKVVLSSTTYENFFKLRLAKDPQPEMQTLARMMKDAYDKSVPLKGAPGERHLPYISKDDYWKAPCGKSILEYASAARCARVSYDRHGEGGTLIADAERGKKLASDGHWSPLEHQATCLDTSRRSGNFVGWGQFRKELGG